MQVILLYCFLRLSACTTVLSSVQNYPFRVGASLDNVVLVNLPTI